MSGKIAELIKQNGWHQVKLFGPVEDLLGCELSDGTYYPPTFKKQFTIMGLRSDGTLFEVRVIFEKDEVDMKTLELVGAKFTNALMVFEEFRTCPCLVNKPCDKHKPLEPPNASTE